MRGMVLSAPIWLMLGAAALAQGTVPAGNPPPLPPANPNYPAPAPNAAAPTPMQNSGAMSATMGGSVPLSRNATNLNQQDQPYARVAPALPSPDLGPNATPVDYLHAAQSALAAGKTGEAQQSLEMAQTRLLDRSVPYGQVNTPIRSPAIDTINQALQALGAGNQAQTMQLIQAAIPQAEAAH